MLAGIGRSRAQWEAADRLALSVSGAPSPDSLSRLLTAGLQSDREKTRAFFRWVTANIRYRLRSPRRAASLRDTALDGLALDERIAWQVLRDREGVCEGYARLFNTLCRYAGIRSVLVTGYARNEYDRSDRSFGPNHSWNAVWVDSAWQLLDATWGAGYFRNGSDEFVTALDETYFFPDPARFIGSHFPEDLRWSLLPQPPAPGEFRHGPFRTQAALKYRIAAISPVVGVLRPAPGDTVRLQVSLQTELAAGMIASGSALEPGPGSTRLNEVFLEPRDRYPSRKLTYTWVATPGVEWLHLRCNDDVILHYRVELALPSALLSH
ncbi:transglutaminase domain-containing protein [Flaviaesturariibacter flavus]|uniref:transglutaminase domain-containing protein n=1 Tax=Flaviaesturariibacter flavus TaxID=2502780 RepID=UPI0014044EE0|nr:transglutaminase domain-containing protein [Flaviaesturariibacter flavus]